MLIGTAVKIMRMAGVIQFTPGQVLREYLFCCFVGAHDALFVPAALFVSIVNPVVICL